MKRRLSTSEEDGRPAKLAKSSAESGQDDVVDPRYHADNLISLDDVPKLLKQTDGKPYSGADRFIRAPIYMVWFGQATGPGAYRFGMKLQEAKGIEQAEIKVFQKPSQPLWGTVAELSLKGAILESADMRKRTVKLAFPTGVTYRLWKDEAMVHEADTCELPKSPCLGIER